MLIMTKSGFYCPAGNFYIDPKHAVENAVITHAHSDHARRGSKRYYCTDSTQSLLRTRLGQNISIITYPYGTKFRINDVEISFHPAGHILGSAQIRIELYGEVWVVSGDYKRSYDSTCEPFEVVPCDVFVTEATFGTPSYIWDKTHDFAKSIYNWWQLNATEHYNSLLFAYSLGKAQRILGLLSFLTNQTIYCDPITEAINNCYRLQGIQMVPTICLSNLPENTLLEKALIVAPSSFMKTKFASYLGKKHKSAFASGWMQDNSKYQQTGFAISDHADWNDLIRTIEETKAKRVFVQHRSGKLIKELRSRGIKAFPDSALIPKNPNQLCLF